MLSISLPRLAAAAIIGLALTGCLPAGAMDYPTKPITLIAGTIPIGFDVSTAYVQLVKGGQLKALALTGTKRSELLPDVPTIVEAGFPNLVSENYFGISAPPGTPKDIVDRLHKAFTEAVALPATKKKLEETGVVIRPMSQPEFTAYVAKQAKDWEPAVRASGAKL